MSWSQIRSILLDKQTGATYVNPAKQFIQPFELPPEKPNQLITMAAGQQVGPFPFTAKDDGPIELFYIKVVVYDENDAVVTNYNIDWMLEDAGKKVLFSNRRIPLIATAGDGGRPYVLPETIYIPSPQSIFATFWNNDATERTVEILFGGIKFYQNAATERVRADMFKYTDRRERTYCYFQTTDNLVSLVGSAAGVPAFCTIPDQADLEIFKLTAQSTATFRCQIKDGSNDRSLTGGVAPHCSLLFGGHVATAIGGGIGGSGGVYPARWATTFMVRRSVKIELDFDNLSGSSNTVKPVLAGRKIGYVL